MSTREILADVHWENIDFGEDGISEDVPVFVLLTTDHLVVKRQFHPNLYKISAKCSPETGGLCIEAKGVNEKHYCAQEVNVGGVLRVQVNGSVYNAVGLGRPVDFFIDEVLGVTKHIGVNRIADVTPTYHLVRLFEEQPS